MLKLFNRKKKDNKGFTLVELVIVIAILAILVGLLAPQYTKYVEKSRKAADASNLEEIVKELKVVASDPQYSVPAGTFTIVMDHENGTTISLSGTSGVVTTTTEQLWTTGMKSLLEGNWTEETAGVKLKSADLKLKSNKWVADTYAAAANGKPATGVDGVSGHQIGASIVVNADGQMTVTYSPSTIKEGTK